MTSYLARKLTYKRASILKFNQNYKAGMEKIILAYCRDNTDLAETIDVQLGRVGIPFEHVSNQPGAMPGQFAAWVQSTSAPVILFITDNFLKNKNCMSSALEMIKSLVRHNRLLTVVADGWQKNGGASMIGTSVETKIDRVADAIKYLNYWQNAYLEIQNREEGTGSDDYKITKEISTELPDFLNLLRDYTYVQLSDFSANDYELFFKKFGIIEWHEQYQKMASVVDTDTTPSPDKKAIRHSVTETPPSEAGDAVPTVEENDEKSVESNEREAQKITQQKIEENEPLQSSPPVAEEFSNGFKERMTMGKFKVIDQLLDEIVEEEQIGTQDAMEESVLEEVLGEAGKDQELLKIEVDSVSETENEVETEAESAFEPIYPKAKSSPSPEKVLEDAQMDAAYWFEKGETEKGLRVLSVAIELHENNAPLRMAYARALLEKGDAPEAAQLQLDFLLQQGMLNTESYHLMGDVAYRQRDFHLAKQYWEKVLKLDAENVEVHEKLGDLNANHFRGFQKDAAKHYERAIEKRPEDSELHFKHGALLLEHLNKPKKAARFLLQALNIDSKNARAWSDLAIAYHHLGEHQRADAAYRRAIALNPNLQTETGDALFLLPEKNKKQASEQARLTVLITGATSGIGRATAQLFAENGHRVILTGRRIERLEQMKSDFSEKYEQSDCYILNFDVRDRNSTTNVLHGLPDAWRNIDLLINNAGLAKGLDPIHEGSFEHWDTMIDTNLKGLLNVTRIVSPWMVARNKGHIINVGSSAGKEAYGKGAVYCATKFGVDALTKAMRIDLHTHNIRVSQVSPGHVEETEFAVTRFDGDAEKAKIYNDFQPLKSSDVADAIYFMATRPAHVNIQDIYLFGTQQANATTIDRSGRGSV